ncbi:50S ribosomal protein L37e [Candidatus Woesearchaeota archaeon]|nr:50S ribosomal protein L37e [Candidatus Woesearchaeota archaeon]
MTKGTSSMGKKSKKSKLVIPCRRCGSRSYHVKHKKCAACGYGATATLRRFAWQTKWKGKSKIKKR